MAGSINDFKASFTKDIARKSRFDVEIPIPATLLLYYKSAKELRYRCEASQLPGRTFATAEQRTYGPIEKHPYLSTYNDIDMTFIVTDGMDEKKFFDAWMNFINPNYSNDFRYKGDYVTTMKVNQYDVAGNLSYSVDLIDAFPISMNQLDVNWSDEGFHKLTVTFAYKYWKNNDLQTQVMQGIDSVVGMVTDKFGGLGGTINSSINSAINNNIIQPISSQIGSAVDSIVNKF